MRSWFAWWVAAAAQQQVVPQDLFNVADQVVIDATSEFAFLFRQAGRRKQQENSAVLELAEFDVRLRPGFANECAPACGQFAGTEEEGISSFESCCAVGAMFAGATCNASRAKAKLCYRIGSREGAKTKKRRGQLKHYRNVSVVRAVVAGGSVDAVGLLVAVRSALDAAADPRSIKLYVALDGTEAETRRLDAALRCAVGDSLAYKLARITSNFLERRSTTFQRVFAATIARATRTRKTLVKAPANYARMYLPEIFAELDKQLVVYLDADVLISSDLVWLAREATA